jgi:hypothetical protein
MLSSSWSLTLEILVAIDPGRTARIALRIDHRYPLLAGSGSPPSGTVRQEIGR